MSIIPESEQLEYHALDYQLANLLEQLNGNKNNELRQISLKISKQTREGQIALACDSIKSSELLNHKVVGSSSDYKPLILENGFIYLRRYWDYQQRLANEIKVRLLSSANQPKKNTHIDQNWIKQRLQYYFSQDNKAKHQETNWQEIAAALALISPFLIISGGPGTGKTTTITRILALLIEQQQMLNKKQPLRFLLAAPTGKAAMRMSESIRESVQWEGHKITSEIKEQLLLQEASTIHRLLAYIPHSTEFRFNKKNPLATDLVIIDEASMIDLALMTKLFEAIPPQAKIILLGDKDQLLSVETGSVFTDICASANNKYNIKTITYLQAVIDHGLAQQATQAENKSSHIDNQIVCLRKNWRFDQHSGIGKLATAVNRGESKKTFNILENKKYNDINLLSPNNLTVKQFISSWQYYLQALKTKTSIADLFNAFNQFRILTALRKGKMGCHNLNTQLEKQLSQQNQLDTSKQWYHGRPIMITENSYRTGLFNGDIGITQIDHTGQVKVWFQTNEGEKAFAPVRLPQYETTWVMTIHKSQGSEFERVLMILPPEDSHILTRQLIYTGITRAKKQLEIIADPAILNLGIKRKTAQATQIRSIL